MECILAEHAGFCFGVNKAVECVYNLLNTTEKIYTFGPIIHNEEVVKDLESKGVSVINDISELDTISDGTVVIRAHGIPKENYESIENRGLKVVDGTCPFVKRIHNIVEEKSSEGYQIVIIGNAGHPEVLGIMGWSKGNPIVVETPEEAQSISCNLDTKLCIVSQTTFNLNKFQELVEIIKQKGYNVNVVNTICNATKERQESAGLIASKVDAMIVIGDKSSSNTQKLYDICKGKCLDTYFIQTAKDLNFDLPKTASLVGITAGASTPNNIIEEVQNYVRINF